MEGSAYHAHPPSTPVLPVREGTGRSNCGARHARTNSPVPCARPGPTAWARADARLRMCGSGTTASPWPRSRIRDAAGHGAHPSGGQVAGDTAGFTTGRTRRICATLVCARGPRTARKYGLGRAPRSSGHTSDAGRADRSRAPRRADRDPRRPARRRDAGRRRDAVRRRSPDRLREGALGAARVRLVRVPRPRDRCGGRAGRAPPEARRRSRRGRDRLDGGARALG